MQHPTHDILALSARRKLTKERMVGYALAGVVNIGLISVLIEGLAVHYLRHEPPELRAQVIAPTKPETVVNVPKPTMIVPKDTVAPPEIVVQQPQPQNAIQTKTAPAAPSAASAR